VTAGLTVFVAAGLSACYGGGDGAPAQEEPAIDLAAEEAAVRQVNLTWLERFRARDAEGVAALFVEDGWTIGDDGLRDGRAAILADMAAEYEENPDATAGAAGGRSIRTGPERARPTRASTSRSS
jgi:hypothetical protein